MELEQCKFKKTLIKRGFQRRFFLGTQGGKPSPPLLLYCDIVLNKIMEITEQNFKKCKKVPLTNKFAVLHMRIQSNSQQQVYTGSVYGRNALNYNLNNLSILSALGHNSFDAFF